MQHGIGTTTTGSPAEDAALLARYRALCASPDENAAAILDINCEHYTVWNARKRRILALAAGAERAALLRDDLQLTQALVATRNPKSYWVWFHRAWCLQQQGQDADWPRELKLVARMLDMDQRNFHGWDYRRYVVAQLSETADDPAALLAQELEYCLAKIRQNFSNYSAWHYYTRLSLRAPDRRALLDSEYDMIRNAVFTEPGDASAWNQLRVLIMKEYDEFHVQQAFVSPGKQADAEGRHTANVALVFSEPVTITSASAISFAHEGNPAASLVSPAGRSALIWRFALSFEAESSPASPLTISLEGASAASRTAHRKLPSTLIELAMPRSSFTRSVSENDARVVAFRRELAYIEELYEMEPDNSNVLTALVFLRNNIPGNIDAILAHLDKLAAVDALRKGYYRELRSAFELSKLVRESSGAEMTIPAALYTRNMLLCLPSVYHSVAAVARVTVTGRKEVGASEEELAQWVSNWVLYEEIVFA